MLFGTTAAAVSYPQRTLEIAETGYYHTTSSIAQIFAPSAPTTTERVVEILDDKEPEVAVESEIAISEVVATSGEEVTSPVVEVVDEIISAVDAETSPPKEEVLIESTDIAEAQPESNEALEVEPEATEAVKIEPDTSSDESTEVLNDRQEEVISKENVEIPASNAEYDPGQTELQEITVVSLEEEKVVDNKDTRLDLDSTSQDSATIEGDLGQSDPEDSDMYSTRS